MKTIRIALAQINTTVGDLTGNRKKILHYVEKAVQISANVVVFPELTITGYPPEDLLLKKHFVDDNLRALKAIAPAVKNIVAVVGFVDRDKNGLIYNAAAVISDGKIRGVYRKNNLPNYGVFDEKRYFAKGSDSKIFNYGGVTFGINICEDIWNAKGPCALQAKAGAQILFNLSSSPYHAGKTKEREKVLSKCAIKNRVFISYCNLVGGQDELVFDGSSVILNPKGAVMACGKAFEEDLIVADIQIPTQKTVSRGIPVASGPLGQGKILIAGKKEQRLSTDEEIYKALVLGTRDYMRKNGFQKAIIGISGGIDSALVAAIACDAIGRKNVLAVSMPSLYTSAETKKDAKRMAKNLGISFQEIPIKKLFDAYLKTLRPAFKGLPVNVAEENIQARIRGNILMAFSNKLGHIVLTTGNKSEIAVGYCTLYGDMAGGFAVIKDVPKTTVYQLAHFVNKKAGWPLIPESIIKRPPTAELKKNQKDQDTLPPYEILDGILKAYVEEDKGLSQVAQRKGGVRLVKKITSLIDRMEYKRRQAPLGVKITPKAFGKDRRLPITNQYKPRSPR